MSETISETANKQVCHQCGRIGVRGFESFEVTHEGVYYGTIVQCSNFDACMKRVERWGHWMEDEGF